MQTNPINPTPTVNPEEIDIEAELDNAMRHNFTLNKLVRSIKELTDYYKDKEGFIKKATERATAEVAQQPTAPPGEPAVASATKVVKEYLTPKKRRNIFHDCFLFHWGLDKKELDQQIKDYDTQTFFGSSSDGLAFLGSSKGLAIAIILGSIYFNLLRGFNINYLPDIIIKLIVSFLIFKGVSGVLMFWMIFYTWGTIAKFYIYINNFIYSIQSSPDITVFIIFGAQIVITGFLWLLFMRWFWQAYQVEKGRRRLKQENDANLKTYE